MDKRLILWIVIPIVLVILVFGCWRYICMKKKMDSYGEVDSLRIEECKDAIEKCLEMNRMGANQICPQMLSNGDCNI